jgi:hypothetical protein
MEGLIFYPGNEKKAISLVKYVKGCVLSKEINYFA